jgi:hypothetical protein
MNIRELLFHPMSAITFFCAALILMLILLDDEGAFTKKFLHIGPESDTSFAHIPLDSWKKVYIVYGISFMVSLLQIYYSRIIKSEFIIGRFVNPAYKEKLDVTKNMMKFIILVNPLARWILHIITFFVTMTMQLQFILPQLIAHLIVLYPYHIKKYYENTYRI